MSRQVGAGVRARVGARDVAGVAEGMRRARWGAGLGLVAGLLMACQGAPADPGRYVCQTDDDCAGDPLLRACRDGTCADPGCPAASAYVGAGVYVRGCDATEAGCTSDAQPAHAVTLTRGFCVALTELSVAQYRACAQAGRCSAPGELRCSADFATWTEQPGANETLPMSCLYHPEAAAACAYLGGRLPTEAEWEKAARGRDRRPYPWGRAGPIGCDQGVNWAGAQCPGRPWPALAPEQGRAVGAMLYSAGHAFDMAGNVWEWTADTYAPDAYAACASGCADPTGPQSGALRVRRGGSFLSTQPQELRAFFREYHLPMMARSDSIGARCVFDPPR